MVSIAILVEAQEKTASGLSVSGNALVSTFGGFIPWQTQVSWTASHAVVNTAIEEAAIAAVENSPDGQNQSPPFVFASSDRVILLGGAV